jgi:hypothetical protein
MAPGYQCAQPRFYCYLGLRGWLNITGNNGDTTSTDLAEFGLFAAKPQ